MFEYLMYIFEDQMCIFGYLKIPDIILSLVSSHKLDWTQTFGTYCISFDKCLVKECDLTTLFIKCRSLAERFYENLQKNWTKNFRIVLQTQQTRFKQALNFKFYGTRIDGSFKTSMYRTGTFFHVYRHYNIHYACLR